MGSDCSFIRSRLKLDIPAYLRFLLTRSWWRNKQSATAFLSQQHHVRPHETTSPPPSTKKTHLPSCQLVPPPLLWLVTKETYMTPALLNQVCPVVARNDRNLSFNRFKKLYGLHILHHPVRIKMSESGWCGLHLSNNEKVGYGLGGSGMWRWKVTQSASEKMLFL